MSKYIPGVCNIGPDEIKMRKKFGWISTGISVILFLFFLIFHTSPSYRLIIFLPIMSAAIGFLQAYFHFCVAFGFSGIYNVLKPAGQTETVVQMEFRKQDRQKAIKITVLAVLVGVIVTGVIYFI